MKIKKIIYIPCYGCWGMIDNMNHLVVTIEREKIKFSLIPLGTPHENNCLVEFTYNPNYEESNIILFDIDEEREYELIKKGIDPRKKYSSYFEELETAISRLDYTGVSRYHICDAMPSEIHVVYDDKTKKKFFDFDDKLIELIDEIINRYMPDEFEKIYLNDKSQF